MSNIEQGIQNADLRDREQIEYKIERWLRRLSRRVNKLVGLVNIQFDLNWMSMDESQEEDCTVYIQELKSDNPSLKLNAASKIGLIGEVLGHNRVKDELIPYLIEIVEQMDNDNDFLTRLAEGVLELKKFTSNQRQIANLIYPLRVLAALDQPPVRDKAVACLKKLAEGQNKDFYEQHYFPLLTSLVQAQSYASKIAAIFLIPTVYPHLPEPKQAQLRKSFKELGLKEGSPLIRRAVGQTMEELGRVVDKKVIKADFFEIWQSLIGDTFDIIRIKALESAVILARVFKKDEVTDKLFKPIKLVDAGKKSWRVRYALAEALVALGPYLEKDILRKDVVEIFEDLLKDQEAEVRAIALIKLPDITQKLSQGQAWTVFFQYFEKGSKDANKDNVPTVKLGLVQAIIPYFRTVDKNNVVQSGIPILASLLKDESHVVRIAVMQRVMQLSEVVGPEDTLKHLIPLIEGCLNDKKWRFKLAISQNIPNFFKALPYDNHKDFLDKVINTFLKDHNYAVREQTIKSIVAARDSLGTEKYLELLHKHVGQLSGEANYIYRVTACLFLKEIQGLDRNQLAEIVSILVRKFENEKVANVLVSFFISYSQVKSSLSAASRKEVTGLIGKVKQQKQDEDVLYYAGKAEG